MKYSTQGEGTLLVVADTFSTKLSKTLVTLLDVAGVLNYTILYLKEFDTDDSLAEQDVTGMLPELGAKAVVACGEVPCQLLFGASCYQARSRNASLSGLPLVGTLDPYEDTLQTVAEDLDMAYAMTVSRDISDLTHRIFVTRQEQVEELARYIRSKGRMTFDVETTGLEWWDSTLYMRLLSLSFQPGTGYAIPWEIDQAEIGIRLDLTPISKLFSDPLIEKIAHNAKFDCHWLMRYGFTIRGTIHDTISMHHVFSNIDEHGLKKVVAIVFPLLAGYDSKVRESDWKTVPISDLWIYGATDADVTYRLFVVMEQELLEDPPSMKAYQDIFCPALPALLRAEHDGAWVDVPTLERAQEKALVITADLERFFKEMPEVLVFERWKRSSLLKDKLAHIRGKIESSTKDYLRTRWEEKEFAARSEGVTYELNLGSPKQLSEFLYSPRGLNFDLPVDQWGKSIASTNKDLLSQIDHPFIDKLVLYRQVSKTQSTYLKGLTDKVEDGRIHGTFNQSGAGTFRMSASNPNLQNIISRTKFPEVEEIVSAVKRSFVVPKGMVMLQTDFSQAELRMIAHFAGETNMINAYLEGKDLHEIMAATALGISLDEFHLLDKAVQKKSRQEAKAINFGFIYGMSAKSFVSYARISYGVHFTLEEAEHLRNTFFRMYPRLLAYHAHYRALASRQGFVRTLFGTRIFLPDIYSRINSKRSHAERNAINGPIQGSAGLVTEIVLGRLEYYPIMQQVKLLTTVHDSTLHAVPLGLLPRVAPLVKHVSENIPFSSYGATFDKLPLKVDQEVGYTWKDLQDISTFNLQL